jgi:hypothetical protein
VAGGRHLLVTPLIQCHHVSRVDSITFEDMRRVRTLLTMLDRGQGLNHCICDVSHILEGLRSVRDGKKALADAVDEYEKEMVPRGREEVTCSVENGFMLHDWNKIQQSPVFQRGFKPMDGHASEEKEEVASEDSQV